MDAVLGEVDRVIARGVNYIYWIDEIFGVGRNVQRLLEEIAKRLSTYDRKIYRILERIRGLADRVAAAGRTRRRPALLGARRPNVMFWSCCVGSWRR